MRPTAVCKKKMYKMPGVFMAHIFLEEPATKMKTAPLTEFVVPTVNVGGLLIYLMIYSKPSTPL